MHYKHACIYLDNINVTRYTKLEIDVIKGKSMKVVTKSRASRPQTRALVSDNVKLHAVDSETVTVSVPFLIESKDMFLSFSEQELHTVLSYIAEHKSAIDNFVSVLAGDKPHNPSDDNGSLV